MSVEYLCLDLPILLTRWLNGIIHVRTLMCVHSSLCLFTCLHSVRSSPGILSHSCMCLSDSLSVLFLLPGFLKRSQSSCGLRQCFVSRMRETLLSGIFRSCYCNFVFPLCYSNSQDTAVLLTLAVLHFALFFGPCPPLCGFKSFHSYSCHS